MTRKSRTLRHNSRSEHHASLLNILSLDERFKGPFASPNSLYVVSHSFVLRRSANYWFLHSETDDWGSEGPEAPDRGAGSAKRRSAEGWSLGRCAVAPPQHGGLRAMLRKIFFEISVVKSRILKHFASNITKSVSFKIFSFLLLVTLVNNVISYMQHLYILSHYHSTR